MHLFQDLPPELLGEILSFDEVNHKSLYLFLCGSKILNRKLAIGVHTVELQVVKQFILVALPSFLTSLRSLRSLRVSVQFTNVARVSSFADILRNLSSTLEKLVLDTPFAIDFMFHVFPASSAAGSKASGERNYDISSMFPRLRTLILPEKYMIRAPCRFSFSESLTELRCSLDAEVEQALFSALPRPLLYLTVDYLGGGTDVENWELLPPHLETFVIGRGGYATIIPFEYIRKLPRTLTRMTIPSRAAEFSLAFVSALPPALKAISAYSTKEADLERLFCSLPPQLETFGPFATMTFPRAVFRMLPPTVTSLGTCFDIVGMLAIDLPPRLTSLTLRGSGSNFTAENALVLPPTITHLSLSNATSIEHDALPLLPANLRSLECSLAPKWTTNIDEVQLLVFPSRLRSLHLATSRRYPPDKNTFDSVERGIFKSHLPESLLILNISDYRLPYSAISFLTAQLQQLRVDSLYDDRVKRSSEEASASLASQEETLKLSPTESPSSSASSEKKDASIFGQLPRSLTALHILNASDLDRCQVSEWANMPPNLTTFQLNSPAIHAGVLLTMPVSKLGSLSMQLKHLRPEHFQHLPPAMVDLNLAYDTDVLEDEAGSEVSLAIARAAPLGLLTWSRELEPIGVVQQELNSVAARQDFDELHKLVGSAYWPRYL